MRSIAIINQKGGVGKTTTAVNVSAALARANQRVLLLDLDPQSHATMHVGVELTEGEPNIYDTIVRGTPIGDTARGVSERLVVIPASVDLVGADIELAERERRNTVLARALEPYQPGFDFCIIDCGPSLGLLTVNALAAVQEVIIPLQPHFLALQGLGRLLETITLVRREINPTLRITGVVLCMYETGTRLAQEIRDDVVCFIEGADKSVPWHGARVFSTPIRRNIKLAECPSFGKTIFEYAPSSHGAADYEALAGEILTSARPPEGGQAVIDSASRPAAEVLPAGQTALSPSAKAAGAGPVGPGGAASSAAANQPDAAVEDTVGP